MSDFIIQFGTTQTMETPDPVEQRLRNRPWMQDRPLHIESYAWGRIIFQEAADPQYAPYKTDHSLTGCIGRPRFLHRSNNDLGFCAELSEQWESSNLKELTGGLTGMFAMFKTTPTEVAIIRDHMGAQPVYSAYDASEKLMAIGTDVEALAEISGRKSDFDSVSLGELLVYNSITFPFSSRHGIEEFEPGVLIEISCQAPEPILRTQTYWQPTESTQPKAGLVEELVDRMRAVGSDIAASADSIGVTLSGGLDSRAVLSVLPKDQVTAVTYVTHENYETDVAQDVAKAYGCKHVFAQRSEDYYLRVLLNSGPELLGTERRAMLHGLCIPESGLHNRFDVILGGQLSDTYLKDHYMPKWQRESFRPKGPKERLGIVLRKTLGIPQPEHLPGVGSNLGRYRLEEYLAIDIRQLVRDRRAKRLEDIRSLRPQTAEEWVKFWPTSRQDDLSHIIGNSKLFAFETLFSHKYIIDFAAKLLPAERYSGAIAGQAFSILYSQLGNIPDANTGRLPGQQSRGSAAPLKRGPDQSKVITTWNNVSDSWFDMVALQQHAPEWQDMREQLVESGALAILEPIIDRSAAQLISAYSTDLGPTFNQMFLQLAMAVDAQPIK